jgi:hypothetical protein
MSEITVYIAAPIGEFMEAERLAAHFRFSNWNPRALREVRIVSRWHALIRTGQVDPRDEAERRSVLGANLDDLAVADVGIALTWRGTPKATFGEIAWLLCQGSSVVWVHGGNGEGRNIFDAHERVRLVEWRDGAIDEIAEAARTLAAEAA